MPEAKPCQSRARRNSRTHLVSHNIANGQVAAGTRRPLGRVFPAHRSSGARRWAVRTNERIQGAATSADQALDARPITLAHRKLRAVP